jgi:hypothetical protein
MSHTSRTGIELAADWCICELGGSEVACHVLHGHIVLGVHGKGLTRAEIGPGIEHTRQGNVRRVSHIASTVCGPISTGGALTVFDVPNGLSCNSCIAGSVWAGVEPMFRA